jgi:LIM domain
MFVEGHNDEKEIKLRKMTIHRLGESNLPKRNASAISQLSNQDSKSKQSLIKISGSEHHLGEPKHTHQESTDSLAISRQSSYRAASSDHKLSEVTPPPLDKAKLSPQAQLANYCRQCTGRLTEGDVVLASSKLYHIDHFRCNRCQKDISACVYYEYDVQVLCQPCFFNTDATQDNFETLLK